MKKWLVLIVFICVMAILSACSNQAVAPSAVSDTQEEASWAYAFVKVAGVSYEITDEEVPSDQVGELLGEVKRNVVDMDTKESYVETDFDSNELLVGTKLFASPAGEDYVIYEQHGKYFKAKKP